ncbi:hypothetical protein EKH55_3868 [Sinorhizobium alkalisoli]|nr:hypothetical protein EKH55_3868 [Sinorhizobium alkalisoli]
MREFAAHDPWGVQTQSVTIESERPFKICDTKGQYRNPGLHEQSSR